MCEYATPLEDDSRHEHFATIRRGGIPRDLSVEFGFIQKGLRGVEEAEVSVGL